MRSIFISLLQSFLFRSGCLRIQRIYFSYLKIIRMLTFENLFTPSLEEECESSLCTSALRARNLELSQDLRKLTAVFEKLQTYISLLALPSMFVCCSCFNLKNSVYKKLGNEMFSLFEQEECRI